MIKEKCRYFDTCNAPICPLDDLSIEFCTWYPDEEVCKLKSVPNWVKKQRRIQKKGITYEAGFFTVDMLKSNFKITKSLKGLSDIPGDSIAKAEKEWIKKHPGTKMSEAQKQKARVRMRSWHEKK